MNQPHRQFRNRPGSLRVLALAFALGVAPHAAESTVSSIRPVTVWEPHELTFTSQQQWGNPFLDVDFWVRVRGPDGFERKVYGFWDGGNTWKARAQMYLSLLNGGLAGHIWGSGYFSGLDGRSGLTLGFSPSMGHLREFFISQGARYQELIPFLTGLQDPQGDHVGLAATADHSLLMGYFARGKKLTRLQRLPASAIYQLEWWHPNDGTWSDSVQLESDAQGGFELPPFPSGGTAASDRDWAFRACRLK